MCTPRDREVDYETSADSFTVDGVKVAVTGNTKISDTDWALFEVDIVCCCTVRYTQGERANKTFA